MHTTDDPEEQHFGDHEEFEPAMSHPQVWSSNPAPHFGGHRGFRPGPMNMVFRAKFGPGGGPRWGGPHGGPPFGGFGGPRFGRGRKTARGDVRTAALSLLAEQPLHGYQIIQEITARSGGAWKPSAGSIYPALQQLADEGLIRAEEADGRRVFHLTETGQAYVAERRDELAAVWDQTSDPGSEGVQELRALIPQVAMAVMQVAQAGSDTQVSAARQILTNTRRQLYRLLAEDEAAAEEPRTGGADPS